MLTQQRSTLANSRKDSVPARSLRLGGMYIRYPSEQQRDRRKDLHGKEDAEVAGGRGGRSCIDHESYPPQSCCKSAERTSHLEAIGEPAECDDGEEAKDVGRSGETLRLDLGEGTHF